MILRKHFTPADEEQFAQAEALIEEGRALRKRVLWRVMKRVQRRKRNANT